MNFVTNLIAQAAPAGQGAGGLMSFLPMILIFAAMYFLLIAPQRKKQKEHQKMITELKSGTDVVTTGGIYGTITNVKDDRFVLKISDTTKIEISKASVANVIKAAE
ncbi:preprotein translocase subunit YajC [Puniceicoccaceae bacterium K14]|nr:preprotein translocase subunit YajC [Puniceicoccaceae bacterium K14]